MSSVNKVILIGNLGADPELKHTNSGMAVCTLSVATTDKKKDQSGEWTESTEWHRVNIWKNVAESCAKYLRKGSKIYVEGKLGTRSWEQDGVKRYSTEITAFTVQFLDPKEKTPDSGSYQPQSKPVAEPQGNPALDDIPF